MPQEYALESQATGGEREQPPLDELALGLTDHAGRERQGRAVLLARWKAEGNGEGPARGEDFRIVVLSEPPEDPISPEEGVVVSAPVRQLRLGAGAARKPAATKGGANQSDLALTAKDMELLRKGRLFAATPLQVTAEDVYAGGEAHLTLLARDLLASEALADYMKPIAIALNAPAVANPADHDSLDELRTLVEDVGEIELEGDALQVKEALSHLSEMVNAADAEHLLASAERIYPNKRTLMEEIYMLRAFRQSPEEANDLLCMRRFLDQAVVPAEEEDLALDRAAAMEQLTFVTLAVEPHRLPAARAMVECFHRKYVSVYREHHTRYWAQMARLHARLREEQTQVEGLRRLNSLAELGPPAGMGAVAAYEELVAETAGCPLIGGVEEMLDTEAACPACALALDQWAPVQRIDEIVARIQRACDLQMERLSSTAVQQVLRRSGDARVEQFLKLVQASQLSSLCMILDDDLVGYLRRFLVESRIGEALEPILDQLQQGVAPKVEEAQMAMRDVSQVLQRGFQATQKALPPAEPATSARGGPSRRKRKGRATDRHARGRTATR